MFSYENGLGLPAGPLAEPAPMWRIGKGKVHFNERCRPNLDPVAVVPWDLDADDCCARCYEGPGFTGHHEWQEVLVEACQAWQHCDMLESNLGHEPALTGESAYNRAGFISWAAPLICDQGAPVTGDSEAAVALRRWYDNTLRPRQRDLLARVVEVLPMLGESDWHLRYAATHSMGYEYRADLPASIAATEIDFGWRAQVLADLREALLWEWFKTAGSPDPAAIADAAYAKARPSMDEDALDLRDVGTDSVLLDLPAHDPEPGQTLREYLAQAAVRLREGALRKLARQGADHLVAEYADATTAPNVLIYWGNAGRHRATTSVRPLVGALMGEASWSNAVDERGGQLRVVPEPLADMFGSSAAPGGTTDGNARTAVTVYGRVFDTDGEHVFVTARLLHLQDPEAYPPQVVLEAARAAHLVAV